MPVENAGSFVAPESFSQPNGAGNCRTSVSRETPALRRLLNLKYLPRIKVMTIFKISLNSTIG